jgi:hypothetical protein
MKSIITGTLAAFVLGAAIASSQTPPAGQAPAGAQPSADQTQPRGQAPTPATPQRSTSATQTYRGFLRGSEASGWTISPMASRAGATGTAGATATAGATPTTYSVMTSQGSKVDLAPLADQCVEIVGALAPESATGGAAGRTSPVAAGEPAAVAAGGQHNEGAAPSSHSATHRALTVTSIKAVEGGCK